MSPHQFDLDAGGSSPDARMFKAIAVSDFNELRTALHAGANVRARDPMQSNRSCLHAMSHATNFQGSGRRCFDMLIQAGADLEALDGEGRTPLVYASFGVSKLASRWLLKAGANPNARDRRGTTPLVLATLKKWPGLAKLIAAQGGMAAGMDHDGDRSAALMAARLMDDELLEILIDAGAKVDVPDLTGIRPIAYACIRRAERCIMLLMAAGADIGSTFPGLSNRTPEELFSMGGPLKGRDPAAIWAELRSQAILYRALPSTAATDESFVPAML